MPGLLLAIDAIPSAKFAATTERAPSKSPSRQVSGVQEDTAHDRDADRYAP
jgi:hypothetical protein